MYLVYTIYQQPDVDTYGYQRKTGKQFLDFIKRVDQKYDSSIKHIFVILDNASIHKSNKMKEMIVVKYHPRIPCISTNQITSRTQSDRGKMVMVTQTRN